MNLALHFQVFEMYFIDIIVKNNLYKSKIAYAYKKLSMSQNILKII